MANRNTVNNRMTEYNILAQRLLEKGRGLRAVPEVSSVGAIEEINALNQQVRTVLEQQYQLVDFTTNELVQDDVLTISDMIAINNEGNALLSQTHTSVRDMASRPAQAFQASIRPLFANVEKAYDWRILLDAFLDAEVEPVGNRLARPVVNIDFAAKQISWTIDPQVYQYLVWYVDENNVEQQFLNLDTYKTRVADTYVLDLSGLLATGEYTIKIKGVSDIDDLGNSPIWISPEPFVIDGGYIRLPKPRNLSAQDNTVSWNEVPGATAYTIIVTNQANATDTHTEPDLTVTEFNLSDLNLDTGTFKVEIYATGTGFAPSIPAYITVDYVAEIIDPTPDPTYYELDLLPLMDLDAVGIREVAASLDNELGPIVVTMEPGTNRVALDLLGIYAEIPAEATVKLEIEDVTGAVLHVNGDPADWDSLGSIPVDESGVIEFEMPTGRHVTLQFAGSGDIDETYTFTITRITWAVDNN